MHLAPIAFAICAAAVPTPEPTACTRTVSPADSPPLRDHRVVGRDERFRHRCRLDERESLGHGGDRARVDHDGLSVRAAASKTEDAIAERKIGDAFAEGADDTRILKTRDVGRGVGWRGIEAERLNEISAVDRGRTHLNANLALAWNRESNVADFEAFESRWTGNDDGAHAAKGTSTCNARAIVRCASVMPRVVRPVVRSFAARFPREAAAWANMGGHSVYWESKTVARLLVPEPKNDQTDLHFWAILDLGKNHYQIIAGGAFDGLASIIVPKAQHWVVKRRAERDSILGGPTRQVNFDCMACGSCCRANEVVLEPEDHERFERTRPELSRRPYAKRRADGKVVLVLLRNRDCKHLAEDNRCNIYELRPNACRAFPVGSESCMYAREEEMDLYDGLPPGSFGFASG